MKRTDLANSYRKANGQFTKKALKEMSEKMRALILAHKGQEYTNPAYFGTWLANRPRHKFKHGCKSVRFQKVFNFQ